MLQFINRMLCVIWGQRLFYVNLNAFIIVIIQTTKFFWNTVVFLLNFNFGKVSTRIWRTFNFFFFKVIFNRIYRWFFIYCTLMTTISLLFLFFINSYFNIIINFYSKIITIRRWIIHFYFFLPMGVLRSFSSLSFRTDSLTDLSVDKLYRW